MTFFVLSLACIYIVVRFFPSAWGRVDGFGAHLQIKAFPTNTLFEHNKFALLRIIFGCVLVIRAWNIHTMLLPSEATSLVGHLSLVNLIAAWMILVGFLTQWSILVLTLLMWQFAEKVLGTSTLGSDIAAMLSLLFFLVGAGKYVSVDQLILNKYPKIIRLLLYFKTAEQPTKIALAKFLTLFAYWALCIYSLAMHINEPAWTSGIVGPLLLTNNFMSTPFEWFQQLFTDYPLAVYLAKYSIWLMMAWYLTVLPFTLAGGLLRKYVIVWGILFFFLSAFVLNLSSLPEIELILWAALFWSGVGINGKRKVEIFFDDKCNLCDKTIQVLTAIDFFNYIQLKPVSKNVNLLGQYNITLEDALEDLYGVEPDSGIQYAGYDFYYNIAKKLIVLWPFVPLLWLGKVSNIGPFIYRKVAARRRKLFGVCALPSQKIIRQVPTAQTADEPMFYSVFFHVLFLGFFFIIAIPIPYINYHGGAKTSASRAAHFYGMAPINVFNITDIRMAENWYTLEQIPSRNILVPLFTSKGARLAMHKSDRVYFGNTVRYRRGFIGKEGCFYDDAKDSIDYLSQVFLALENSQKGRYNFQYVQYHQKLPDVNDIVRGVFRVEPTRVKCSVDYMVEYK